MLSKIFVELGYLLNLGERFLNSPDLIGFTWKTTLIAFLVVILSIWVLATLLGKGVLGHKYDKMLARDLGEKTYQRRLAERRAYNESHYRKH